MCIFVSHLKKDILMKKLTLILITLLVSLSTFGQKYVVGPLGLKDELNPEKTFLVVNVEGKTAKQLYDNSIKYVNVVYKNPSMVIKGNIDGEFLSFVTQSDFYVENGMSEVPFSMTYRTDLTFKDGKVKYEITELTMNNSLGYVLTFTGGGFSYFIYNKNGDLKKPKTKQYLDNYFNESVTLLKTYLEDKSMVIKKDDF